MRALVVNKREKSEFEEKGQKSIYSCAMCFLFVVST